MFMNHVNGLIIIITNGGFYGIDHNLMVDNFWQTIIFNWKMPKKVRWVLILDVFQMIVR